jgi:membrane protease YdiL (CAAX protease family)
MSSERTHSLTETGQPAAADGSTAVCRLPHRLLRIVELLLLYGVMPTLYLAGWLPRAVILILLVAFGWCLTILLRDESFDRARLGGFAKIRSHLPRILTILTLAAIPLTAGVLIFEPQSFLAFPRQATFFWALVMVLYPLVSVYPQEIIYRTFFFHRYRDLFPKRWQMISASAIAFGYVHIIFENVLAVALTLLGGFLFARTYDRSRSTIVVSLEHGLYGCFLFTVGLGMYFYHGAVR